MISNDQIEFNAKILRGEPTGTARLEKVAARIPEPKHGRSGSIYEIQTRATRHAFSAGT